MLLAAFLIAFYLSDFAWAYPVIDPYSAKGLTISHPIFDTYFIDQLYADGVVPVAANDSVDFYLAGSGRCANAEDGICTAVLCGDAICGSNRYKSGPAGDIIDTALVSGNSEIHNMINTRNALRYAAGTSDEYISMVENKIAAMDGSALDSVYLQKRYGSSVKNLVNDQILKEPGLEGLGDLLKRRDADGAISLLDSHFSNEYNISSAYDFYNIYDAVNQRTIGPAQYSEIVNTILGQYGQNMSMDRLINKSGILNTTIGQDVMRQAFDELAKHPEWMKELEKSMNLADSEIFNEMLSKALEEALKDKDMLKNYLDVLSKVMDDKSMRDMFLSASAEAIRRMQASGELDKILEGIKDINIKDQIMDKIKTGAPSALEKIADWVKSNIDWKYVLPVIGLAVIAIVSLKAGV